MLTKIGASATGKNKRLFFRSDGAHIYALHSIRQAIGGLA